MRQDACGLGGISVNDEKVQQLQYVLPTQLSGDGIVVRKGKKVTTVYV